MAAPAVASAAMLLLTAVYDAAAPCDRLPKVGQPPAVVRLSGGRTVQDACGVPLLRGLGGVPSGGPEVA